MPIGTVYKMPMAKKTVVSPRVEDAHRALPGSNSGASDAGQAPRAASTGDAGWAAASSAPSHTPLAARTMYNPGAHAVQRPDDHAHYDPDHGDADPALSPDRAAHHAAAAGTPDMAARTQSYDMAGAAPRTGVDPVVRPYVPQHQAQPPRVVQSRSGNYAPSPGPGAPAPPKRTGNPAGASPAQEAASVAQRMNGGVINTGPASHRDSAGSVPGAASPAANTHSHAINSAATAATAPSPRHVAATNGLSARGPCRIMILYHSTYGHIKIMADAVAAGINSVEGCQAVLYQVPETLTEERLRKMNAPPRANDPTLEYEEMNTILQDVSGIMFGIPTRFGMMPSQMKAWFDSTSKLWTKGHLVGKPAGCFFSTAVQGGGQETTALTTVTQLTHHGMVFVPPGYSFGGRMFDNSEVHGGSPYGAGCIAGGDGSRLPSRFELDFARHQGTQFATVALKLSRD